MTIETEIQIADRFCGPPNSGNGGYVCGRLAEFIDGPAEVMLHKPPPLNSSLKIVGNEQSVQLLDGDTLIGSAKAAVFELEIPEPPTQAQAIIGRESYYGYADHPFDTCFVCGPNRQLEDGLRIFAGAYGIPGKVAAPWEPASNLFEDQATLPHRYIWSALDCPGYAAVSGEEHPVMVLGKLNAKVIEPIVLGERLMVLGWTMGQERRKYFAGTALFNEAGQLKAMAKAIWIKLQPNSLN